MDSVKSRRSTIDAAWYVGESLIALSAPVFAGVLLALSFQSAGWSWLAWVGLLPIASALTRRDRLFETYVGAYLGGLAFNLITTDWVRTLEGGAGLAGSCAPDWIAQSQLLAIFWPLTVLLGRILVSATRLPMSITLPLVWLTHEFLVRYLSVAFDFTAWPMYFLGYSNANHSYLCQVADLTGVSAISAVIACVNGGLWDIYQALMARWLRAPTRLSVFRAACVPGVVVAAACAYGAWRLAETALEPGPSVWLMPEKSLKTPAERQECVAGILGSRDRPDLLLWSETAYDTRICELGEGATAATASELPAPIRSEISDISEFTARPSARTLEDVARQTGSSMVVGCTRVVLTPTALHRYNSAAFLDPALGCTGAYDKVFLVPGWEFTPHVAFAGRDARKYDHGRNYPLFTLRSAQRGKEFRLSASICYDIAFPQLYRRFMRAAPPGPDFFVVSSAEGSDRTGSMARHLLALARIRAIECRRAVVRNVICGYSGLIDSRGAPPSPELPWRLVERAAVGPVPIDHRRTLYVLLGDWLSIVAVISVFAAVAHRRVGSRLRSLRALLRPRNAVGQITGGRGDQQHDQHA
jgi:apolipoprotein N-acyltransferase